MHFNFKTTYKGNAIIVFVSRCLFHYEKTFGDKMLSCPLTRTMCRGSLCTHVPISPLMLSTTPSILTMLAYYTLCNNDSIGYCQFGTKVISLFPDVCSISKTRGGGGGCLFGTTKAYKQ